jgi:hypothetical protein
LHHEQLRHEEHNNIIIIIVIIIAPGEEFGVPQLLRGKLATVEEWYSTNRHQV